MITLDQPNEFERRPELVKARARAHMASMAWRFVWVAVMTLIATLIVYDIIIGNQARAELLDCTTPGGECYEQGQKTTGDAVTNIVDISRLASIAAAYCTDQSGSQSLKEIQTCTEQVLKEQLED